jgi:pSer/pThr/pTyr-binding forkhead associated (FHA) protein
VEKIIEVLKRFFWIAAIVILLFGAAAIVLTMLKRRPPPVKPTPPPPPPVYPEPEAPPQLPPAVSTVQPERGIPYLKSLGRPAGAVYCRLDKPVAHIGRADDGSNDLVIDEHFVGWPTVSRNHALIERDGERFVVVDLDSENGVYVNGQRTGENILYDGCTVSFGQVYFVFQMNQGGGAI